MVLIFHRWLWQWRWTLHYWWTGNFISFSWVIYHTVSLLWMTLYHFEFEVFSIVMQKLSKKFCLVLAANLPTTLYSARKLLKIDQDNFIQYGQFHVTDITFRDQFFWKLISLTNLFCTVFNLQFVHTFLTGYQ